MAALFAAVAAERDGIASEPPIDVAERTVVYAHSADSTVVAEAAAGQVIGMLHVAASRHGYGELFRFVEARCQGLFYEHVQAGFQ